MTALVPLDVLLDAIRTAERIEGEARVHRSYLPSLLALVARGKVNIVREEPSHTVVRLAEIEKGS